jgi:hypothetical protein
MRRELHLRSIEMRGFARDDGWYEVDGSLTDSKPFDITIVGGGKQVVANDPVHDMGVTLVFDQDMVVREVRTFSRATPFTSCSGGGEALQAMVGVCIGAGWSREVRSRLPNDRVCTHLKELLGPMATTAFQALTEDRKRQPEAVDVDGRPLKIDTCFAYAESSELVRMRWPAFHRPRKGD